MREVESISAGSVLGAGFSIYFRNLPMLGLLTAIGFAPYGAYRLWWPLQSSTFTDFIVGLFVFSVCATLVQGGVAYGVVASLRGTREVDLWKVFGRSIRVLPRIILLSVVVELLVLLGLVFLIVPGIIVALMLFVAVPASVMEGGGIGKALKRSGDLTEGHKGSLFAVVVVLTVPILVLSSLLDAAVALGFEPLFGRILDFAITDFLYGGIWATCAAVAYHDLRILNDGVDTEEIAAAFD